MLRNIPEERRPHLYRGGSLKSSKNQWGFALCVLCQTIYGFNNRKAVCEKKQSL
jgi:hypothetical protein